MDENAKYIVSIDIDETLVYSGEKDLEEVSHFDFSNDRFETLIRPGAKAFLENLLDRGDCVVGLWTSATKDYAIYVSEGLLGDRAGELGFVFSRSKMEPGARLAYSERGPKQKNLGRLCRKFNAPINRVIAIDDSPHFYENIECSRQLIKVKPWDGEDAYDNELKKVEQTLLDNWLP